MATAGIEAVQIGVPAAMPDNDIDQDTSEADRRNGDPGADIPTGDVDDGGAYQPPEPPLQGD
jgi:hypothetical protein